MRLFSKGEIDRLGNKIREEAGFITENTLTELQSYRTSHKEALSQIFNILCSTTRKVHPDSIVTFRIKRFESIIGKLQRYPDMRFSCMWDIGGCRCIFPENKDVYKLKKIIESEKLFEIVKEYDYINNPQEDGYKSLHLFVKHNCSNTIIEIQVRSLVDHNWATLVEITDLLFDSRLKEYGDNKDLLQFHLLLSKINKLDVKDKYRIAKILKKYNYFEKLSEVFSRNYIRVRKQWFDLESQSTHKFFLIETNKEDIPKIEAFKSFQEAEDKYFNIYRSRQNANIVITHLQRPNYNQISIAYSNYILTFHSFLYECLQILESLIVESLENKKYYSFFKNFNLYNGLVFNHILNMVTEMKAIHDYTNESNGRKKPNKRKQKEWLEDIRKQVVKSQLRSKKLQSAFIRSMPQSFFEKLLVMQITRRISKNYKRRIDKVIATTK